MTDTTPSDAPSNPAADPTTIVALPSIRADQLRVGDLIHLSDRDGHGYAAYILVAYAATAEGRVQLTVYDHNHPTGRPARYRPDEDVQLAARDLIEPDHGDQAWTEASWRRAYRAGAAVALMDRIRARNLGRPPVDGVDEEVDRLRGRDPLPPTLVPIAVLPELLTVRDTGDPLILDIDQAGVRAVLTLFGQLKQLEDADGSWSGGDVVEVLSGWLTRLGVDPALPFDQLAGRVIISDAVRLRGPQPHDDDPSYG